MAAEERERLQREAEIRQRELEAQRQFELEKLRLQTQVEMRRIDAEQRSEASRSSTSMTSNNEMHGNMRMMKLLMFDEEKDDLDVFLSRFERTCQMCKVPENDRTVHLAKLLKGSALEIYEMMPDGSLFDYELLKNSLLKRFQQNEKGYRKRFKRESMQNGETPQQFVSRLKRYLNKWREMAGLEATQQTARGAAHIKPTCVPKSGACSFPICGPPSFAHGGILRPMWGAHIGFQHRPHMGQAFDRTFFCAYRRDVGLMWEDYIGHPHNTYIVS